MASGQFQRRAKGCLAAAAAVTLLGSAAGAAAQTQRASAPLTVSATVVQTCTVEGVRVPALPPASSSADRVGTPGPTYSIRCGKQTLTYPMPSGSQATPLSTGASVMVAQTPDGRAYVVQF
jgi:hypothetical protein